ncbi:1-acyl-sn-glycerol-3-phosphate acyltransferase [Pseudomonas sp. LS1212]|uniref:lysophospholipid acyltransferase family protein n=1 Tax=Pseudomonas sp. LS1212 TaxID=2972478 RepID=UPI00215BA1E6|nr:lysophospholipid acyltransferase family protein [Pseudomonas sp. LS1212]UVJ42926.1 1-acyl-sn-glycerol-3-phosphate acyltransferase [Pseudomonas sp. LS1212]
MFESLVALGITAAARTITGARSLWLGSTPQAVQRIYYANHSSHGDFVLLWASLPPALRRMTRPVAGADYWQKSPIRRYVISRVFYGVLIDREHKDPSYDPLVPMTDALEAGNSLIIFPEGTRNPEDGLLPFKSGIYHLAWRYRQVELIPVWIANLNRVMPKGRVLPLPLLCTTSFGAPLQLEPGESKEDFLFRSREALLALDPEQH